MDAGPAPSGLAGPAAAVPEAIDAGAARAEHASPGQPAPKPGKPR
jgi:hypothetical protein